MWGAAIFVSVFIRPCPSHGLGVGGGLGVYHNDRLVSAFRFGPSFLTVSRATRGAFSVSAYPLP